MRKNLMYIVIVVQLVIIVSLVRGIITTLKSQKRVDQLADKKSALERTKRELEAKLDEAKSDYYLEKVAREQLNLVKEGETVILIPDYKEAEKKVDQGDVEAQVSNWLRWWKKLTNR